MSKLELLIRIIASLVFLIGPLFLLWGLFSSGLQTEQPLVLEIAISTMHAVIITSAILVLQYLIWTEPL